VTDITQRQRHTIDSILSIFETGKLPSASAYGTATILEDGAGISYGKHQSTDRSGTLDAILLRYLSLDGRFSDDFRPFLPMLTSNESAKVDPNSPPAWCVELLDLLRRAGREDPLMHRAQDEVFDELYWVPAKRQSQEMALSLALSWCIVYDTCIQSGPAGVSRIRLRFREKPPAKGGDERAWAQAYLQARRSWLEAHPNALVRQSVYRIDALEGVARSGNWDLVTPMKVRRVVIA
jgi:chitosanase